MNKNNYNIYLITHQKLLIATDDALIEIGTDDIVENALDAMKNTDIIAEDFTDKDFEEILNWVESQLGGGKND